MRGERRLLLAIAALGLVAAGLALRVRNLGATAFWVDEAESAIDGLTILEHGLPVGRYLDQPLFQNSLLEPDERGAVAPEFDLRDASFGRHRLAVYHGWLPLYAIALAEKLGGLEPDRPVDPPRVLHGPEETARRSVIPRLPALFFSIVFLLAIWRVGAALGGEATGLAVLAVAALAAKFVWFGQQARYYSATLAFTATTALAMIAAIRRGRWRDFLAAGASVILLFHTHSLSALLLAVATLAVLPRLLRAPATGDGTGQGRAGAKVAATLALVLAGSLPWAAWTGWFEVLSAYPRAWTLLDLPRDLFLLRSATRVDEIVIAVAAVTAIAASLPDALRARLPTRLTDELFVGRRGLALSGLWFLVAAIGFPLLVPAPSYSDDRAVLVASVPALLFGAVALTRLLRALSPRCAPIVLLLAVPAWLLSTGQWRGTEALPALRLAKRAALVEMLGALQQEEFTPGARIFATPNEHLLLTWYSGLPVQSVAPVRRSFFEQPPADVWVLEPIERYSPPPRDSERPVASALGARPVASDLGARHVASDLQRAGAKIRGPRSIVDPADEPAFAEQSELTRAAVMRAFDRIPMLRGFPASDWLAFWPTNFYRFAPDHRRLYVEVDRAGDVAANYASLIPRSTARVLDSSWVILAYRRDGRIPGR